LNKVKTIGSRKIQSNATNQILSQEDKIDQLSSLILQQKSNVTVLYELVAYNDHSIPTTRARPEFGVQHDDGDPAFVKMTIKQSLGSIVRVVWSGRLLMTQEPTAMEFIQTISSELLKSNGVIEQLRENETKLKSQMISWKDTAEKLGDTWQEEKDGLFSRFLVLLNRVKNKLRAAHKELKEEKEKNLLQKERGRAPSIPYMSQKTDHLVDYEDEHDIERYDPEQVKRLAMGHTSRGSKRSVRIGNAQQMQKRQRQDEHKPESGEPLTNKSISRSTLISRPSQERLDLNYETALTDSQIIKNPHTGAIEMWSAESIFSQDIHKIKSQFVRSDSTLNSISEQGKYPAEGDKDSKQDPSILDRAFNTTSTRARDPVGEKFSSNEKVLALNKTCTVEDKVVSKDIDDSDDSINDTGSDCSEVLL